MTYVTKHAARRTKERVGLPKRASHKNAERAFEEGITPAETRGALNRYLTGLYLQHGTANNIRVYCGNVYIFCGDILATVLTLPQKYRKTVERILQKRGGR